MRSWSLDRLTAVCLSICQLRQGGHFLTVTLAPPPAQALVSPGPRGTGTLDRGEESVLRATPSQAPDLGDGDYSLVRTSKSVSPPRIRLRDSRWGSPEGRPRVLSTPSPEVSADHVPCLTNAAAGNDIWFSFNCSFIDENVLLFRGRGCELCDH